MVSGANVLIYAVNDESEHRNRCYRRLARFANIPNSAFLTWSICYEFLRVSTHETYSENP